MSFSDIVLKEVINDSCQEIDMFNKMYMIRQDIYAIFYKYKFKEQNDIIAGICFSKDNDDIFFPKPEGKQWKIVARNKMKYMKGMNDEMIDTNIKKIEIILTKHLIKPIYQYKYELKIQSYRNNKRDHIFYNNYDKRIKVHIPDKVYMKLKSTIAQKYKAYFGYVIFRTMLRYEVLLNSRNHQLGLIYNEIKDIDGILLKYYDIEGFASPINRTLKYFCGAYPDVDKYYIGSLGSFFTHNFIKDKKYTVNPPYIENLMIRAAKHVEEELSRVDLKNVKIYMTIPVWDAKSLRELGEKPETEVPYEPYEIIRESKYLVAINKYKLQDYKYMNHLSGDKVSAAHTFNIMLQKK